MEMAEDQGMAIMAEDQGMAIIEREISAYRLNDKSSHSPAWIYFSKRNLGEVVCLLCGTTMPVKNSSTGCMVNHLKRHHGSDKTYNAWTIYEELAELRELRVLAKRKAQTTIAGNRKRASSSGGGVFKMNAHKRKQRVTASTERESMGMETDFTISPFTLGIEFETQMAEGLRGIAESQYDILQDVDDTEEASNHRDESAWNIKQEPSPHISSSSSPSSTFAPIYLDVGGTHYTASLETLTKFPTSRLGRMFDGTNSIVQDSKTERCFVDGDGKLFRHILNFCRTKQLTLPDNFDELDLLFQEANFFDIAPMVSAMKRLMKEKGRIVKDQSPLASSKIESKEFECVTLHISTDAETGGGERVVISAQHLTMEKELPELTAAWKADEKGSYTYNPGYVTRLPVHDYSRLSPLEILRRLLESNFLIASSSASASSNTATNNPTSESFTEYLLTRKTQMIWRHSGEDSL